MTDEDAFLAARKANPADDTARLVYADWLDERDQPGKAAYLRAAVDLTRLRGGTPEYTAAADRLYAACVETAADWRAAAGARFDVFLESYGDKVWAIKVIRERTGFGLSESKALAESAPAALFSWLPFEIALPHLVAFYRRDHLGRPYHPVHVTIRPTPWLNCAPGTTFDVVVDALEIDPADDNWPPNNLEGLSRLLYITLDEARERATNLPLTLATCLAPAKVAAFVQRVNCLLNEKGGLPQGIRVVPRQPKE